ncbi:MFS transporter [Rhizoctonia solani AG-3 Rhs1AP]|uniref:MFS transporter n=1 Tax=Rhizoctonia solani AG-3 Rhs1AP TaxID=1086054 RepID=X8J6T0_9AGAM|nr:MFS transporter [Rhizoctonia solani AG-3 Rhs1AP]
MSQTGTCEIELLDVLPRLEHGTSFDRNKSLHSHTPDASTEIVQYFAGSTQNHHGNASMSAPGLTSASTAVQVNDATGFRIRNIFIEDKVLYLLGSCMGVFAVGLNDTATGANLPSIQDYYRLPYEVVSLVFLAGFGGYLVSCMLNSVLQHAIGTRNVLLMAGILYGGGSLLISFAPPFPLVMVGLCLMGFGGGFYEACLTSVISHFENSRFMNILYAFFGLGALVSPFVIGALAKAGTAWRLYYWFPFSLSGLVTVCHFLLFKRYVMPSDHEEASEQKSVRAKFKQVMRMPITWVGIVLIILSFAIADTLSNWLTSYLIDVKGSGPDISRYQLSMFWAGLTAGRVFFSLPFIHVRERIGNTLLLVSMCGAIGLLWTVDSTPSNWVAVAVAGFFLGPNTPGILSIISTRVPPSLKGIVVSITIGLGLVGATLGPLLFGITVGKIGPGLRVLPPVIIVLASLSALIFWAIPPRRKVE